MDSIVDLVRNLCLLLLLFAFVELLIPRGTLLPLLRLLLGFFLMAALISPVFHFFSQGTVPEEWTSSWSLSPVEQLDYAAQGQSLHAELEEEALAQYRLKLEEELRKLAVSHCGEQTELWAELDEEGQLKGLELCFYGVSRESAAACLQDLARQSALPEEQIHCEIRSEGVAGDGK